MRTDQTEHPEVHLWRVALPASWPAVASLEPTLSPSEQERSRQYLSMPARVEFIATRAVLRQLLAKQARCGQGEIELSLSPYGKPLLGSPAGLPITFNVSHSKGLALIAVAAGCELGVDVEGDDPTTDLARLAKRVCSPSERALVEALEGALQRELFYRCWTRKEAVVKALGVGLRLPLRTIDVLTRPDTVISLAPDFDPAGPWRIQDLDLGPHHFGALACRASEVNVSISDWDWSV